jgi:P27 family predicted phage terminase small subunit
MGKRGAAPAPTGLRLVRGDRKDRINTNEPQAREGIPQCPIDAAPAVHEIWAYTMEQLEHMKIVTLADRDVLYAYCEAVVQHRETSRRIATEGFVVRGMNGGMVKNPLVQIQRDSALLMRCFAQEFGLTPSARSTIKLHVAETAADKGAARLLSS